MTNICPRSPDVSLSGSRSTGRPGAHTSSSSTAEEGDKVWDSVGDAYLPSSHQPGSHTGQEAGKSPPPPPLLSQIPKYKGGLTFSGGPAWKDSFRRTLQGKTVPELWDSHPWRRPRQWRVTPTRGSLDETRPRENLPGELHPSSGSWSPPPSVHGLLRECVVCTAKYFPPLIFTTTTCNRHFYHPSFLEMGQNWDLGIFTPNPIFFCNAENRSDIYETITKHRLSAWSDLIPASGSPTGNT